MYVCVMVCDGVCSRPDLLDSAGILAQHVRVHAGDLFDALTHCVRVQRAEEYHRGSRYPRGRILSHTHT
jgi:hypothetical protein